MVTVGCPICSEVVEVPSYDAISRTDALASHIALKHVSQVRPNFPHEGPPVPHGLGIKWHWKKD